MKNLKRAISMILTALLVLTAVASAAFAETAETPFSLWNPEAPALKTLVAYVEAVTDETSPDYIPPEDRIATFDMDGTLVGELFPTYIEVRLFEERIMRDPTYQPDEEMLEFARMTREHAPDKSLPADYDYTFSQHQAKAFAGMTTNEFADFIKRYLVQEADGFEGMTYAETYYKPMAEVVKYLRDNGFNCYVVSGTDRFVVRTILDGMLDIPTENVIGSDTALAAKDQGDI
ncbi:MAG: HAD family hydrolase, partial [Eubacteriales bacterium]